nr:hypothetical protein TetV2_00588 [Oceanusvirus sp.]
MEGGEGGGGSGSGSDGESKLKEYRAFDESPCQHPNVASSSVVMHLNVPQADTSVSTEDTSYNYEREFLNYTPDVTLPWAYTEEDSFSVTPQELLSKAIAEEGKGSRDDGDGKGCSVVREPPLKADPEEPSIQIEETDESSYVKKVSSVLRDFERKSSNGEWPMSTSVACYWCTHQFDTPPIGLPVKYFRSEDGFYVTGCFCSVSCAAASNLESRESNDTVNERYSMLCALSRILYGTDDVRVAPSWKALQRFGGYMPIEEFRDFPKDRVLLCDVPPMRSLTVQLEEVNEGDVGSGYNYVPLDPVRVERGELSLRRKKPLHDYKSTLDHKMNVTIRSAPA